MDLIIYETVKFSPPFIALICAAVSFIKSEPSRKLVSACMVFIAVFLVLDVPIKFLTNGYLNRYVHFFCAIPAAIVLIFYHKGIPDPHRDNQHL